jgi:putative Mg2+ transporter-C (MgtC) family protein
METLWNEITFGFKNWNDAGIVLFRLLAATLFGALIGVERETAGKSAGVRTHMLVTLGTAVFVIACQRADFSTDGLSRVIQGIVTGIGFIGAGSIIKLSEVREVKGLTTSAGVWMAAAIGVTVGLGAIGLAVIATLMSLGILALAVVVDNWIKRGEITTKKAEDLDASGIRRSTSKDED